jgi:hypothetical protein
MDMVMPPDTPKESLSQCHPVCLQITKAAFAFAVSAGKLNEALLIADRLIALNEVGGWVDRWA